MGALGHYLETEGIATTQISLIREHTETIRPPRALWVPFELGRPLGVPRDTVFQARVLVAALSLLEASQGPVLVDFPEEANGPSKEFGAEPEVSACPVSFAASPQEETDMEKLISAFRREISELRPWYDLGYQKTGRTVVVHFKPNEALEVLAGYAVQGKKEVPEAAFSFAVALRLVTQDIKSFYFEAAIAMPGSSLRESATFNSWFWHKTAAGHVLKIVRERCLAETDESLRMAGAMYLIPMGQP